MRLLSSMQGCQRWIHLPFLFPVLLLLPFHPLCPCAQSTLVPETSLIGSDVSPDVRASCPVLPELSGILSSGVALDLEPHVGEVDDPSTDDEGGDEDENQPGGNGIIVL